MATKSRSLGDILQEFSQHRRLMQQELQKVIVGQNEVIEQLFAAIFTRGHCLLEGVPGLAKTLMVSTLASILDQLAQKVRVIALGDHTGKVDRGFGHRALLRHRRLQQPQITKKHGGHHGRALRYAKGFARGLLHHHPGHCLQGIARLRKRRIPIVKIEKSTLIRHAALPRNSSDGITIRTT